MAKTEATDTQGNDSKTILLIKIGLMAAFVFLVIVSFTVGFGAYVVIMTPEVVFGTDYQGTPHVLAAFGLGALCEAIAFMGVIHAAARFEEKLSPTTFQANL